MKKYIFIIAGLILPFLSFSQDEAIQGTVRSEGNVLAVYMTPVIPVSGIFPSNVITFNIAVSIDAAGLAQAPSATPTSFLPAGIGITEAPGSPSLEGGRYVYTYVMTGNTGMFTWEAGAELPIIKLTFNSPGEVDGKFPRLQNDPSGGITFQSYFYTEVNGADRTYYPDIFYGGAENEPGEFVEWVEATTPLPVTLLSFNAEKYRDRHALLSWVTTNETNSDYFAIQRSFDNRNWMTVGHVKAAGNSTDIRTYEFIDENVYNGRDKRLTAAYRLMMVDLDDQSNLSPIRSVVFIGDGNSGRDLFVYPNPATEGVQVEWSFDNDAQPVRIDLLDASGRLVLTQKLLENSGQEYIRFDGNINTGHYILRLMGEKEILGTTQVIVGNK